MKFLLSLLILLSIIANPIEAYSDEIILAGGCFWCLEHDLEYLDGVNFVKSGYSGGDLNNPSYERSYFLSNLYNMLSCQFTIQTYIHQTTRL